MSDDELRAQLRAEIERLIADCRQAKAERAAAFLAANLDMVEEIALRARKEPKTRDLPSPFVYSMQ